VSHETTSHTTGADIEPLLCANINQRVCARSTESPSEAYGAQTNVVG
jgi:hypothetical protein